MEWPGMNQVVRMSKRRNSSTSRGTPTSPENRPREMSQGRVLAAVGAEPAGHRIHVDAEGAEDLLASTLPASSGDSATARAEEETRGLGRYRLAAAAYAASRGGRLRSCSARSRRICGSAGSRRRWKGSESAWMRASWSPVSRGVSGDSPRPPGSGLSACCQAATAGSVWKVGAIRRSNSSGLPPVAGERHS